MGLVYDSWENLKLRTYPAKKKNTIEEKKLIAAKRVLDKKLRKKGLSNSERKALIEEEVELNKIKNG